VTPVTESTFPAGALPDARPTKIEPVVDRAAETEPKSADV
jgi:hypothetical protein